MSARRSDATRLLSLLVFCDTFCIGAFGPLLPEIGRTQALADWQLGALAGSFGFGRMISDMPAGALAGRRLGTTLALSPAVLLAGSLLLVTAGPFPVLLFGRMLTGLGHTLGMVGGLTAILQDDRAPSASVRLNIFEFAGMLGILGGLTAVAILPIGWGWPISLIAASLPLIVPLAQIPLLRRRFPDRSRRSGEPLLGAPAASPSPAGSTVWLMFAIGAIMALSWSSVSQFLIPLRGTREFGLDRGGVSGLLAVAQLLDLAALLPVGWLADRMGGALMLGVVLALLGLGTWGTGLGSFPYFAGGCALLGLGMAGWMLPLGVVREHVEPRTLPWRTGLYRVGVDATAFIGPLICGMLGETHTALFVGLVGGAAVGVGAHLVWRAVA